MQSEQINELVKALAKAQSEIKGAKMDSKNPYFKSDYADLTSTWEACKGPLTQNGIALMQTVDARETGPVLVTTLAHTSGQWIKSYLPLTIMKNDPQGVGSAITYARRYALAAMVGICPLDDDAEAAMEITEKDRQALSQELQKLPEPEKAIEFFKQKFNVFDLGTVNRQDFTTMISTIKKQAMKKERKYESATVA